MVLAIAHNYTGKVFIKTLRLLGAALYFCKETVICQFYRTTARSMKTALNQQLYKKYNENFWIITLFITKTH